MGGEDAEARRVDLLEARERVTETYLDPRAKMTKETRDARWDAIDVELDRLDFAERVVEVPGAVNWTQPTAVVNGVLRALWERIELGSDLLPKPDGFAWTVPEWRG
jgi:hypothetical protein